MATQTREVKAFLDVRIDILNRNAVEVPPAMQIFRTASGILALVRVSAFAALYSFVYSKSYRRPNKDKIIDSKDSVQLSEYCFSICEAVKTVVQGKNTDDLDESVRVALEISERCVYWPWPCPLTIPNNPSRVIRETERTLRRVENTLHTKYNERVATHTPEIRQMLGTPNTLSFGQNLGVGERAPILAPFDTATTPVSENGMPLAPHGMLIAPR